MKKSKCITGYRTNPYIYIKISIDHAMKQLTAFIICLFVFSGTAKSDNDRPISVNELPQKAQDFIQQFFSGNTVSYAKMEKELCDKNYDVVYANREKIELNECFGILEITFP